MSWLQKPGQTLWDSLTHKFDREDLAPLDDPALSDEQKKSHRLPLEIKYGLVDAQRADDAIQSLRRAEDDVSHRIAMLDRTTDQSQVAQARCDKLRKAFDEAAWQSNHLHEILKEEREALQSAVSAKKIAEKRAKQLFEEYLKGPSRGILLDDEAERKMAFKRHRNALAPSEATPQLRGSRSSSNPDSFLPPPSSSLPSPSQAGVANSGNPRTADLGSQRKRKNPFPLSTPNADRHPSFLPPAPDPDGSLIIQLPSFSPSKVAQPTGSRGPQFAPKQTPADRAYLLESSSEPDTVIDIPPTRSKRARTAVKDKSTP